MADYALPERNAWDWTPGVVTGIPGGIDQYLPGGASERLNGDGLRVVDAPYNADWTGTDNAAIAINEAITDAEPGQVIYCPEGDYKITNSVLIRAQKHGVTLRGDPGATRFFAGGAIGYLIGVGTYFDFTGGVSQAVVGTKTRGTTALEVADETGFTANQIVKVAIASDFDHTRLQAGAAPRFEIFGELYPLSFVTRVTGVESGVIHISPGLPVDATFVNVTITQKAAVPNWREYLNGVEDLILDGAGLEAAQNGLEMSQSVWCWARNVEARGYNNYGIHLTGCYGTELRRCIAGPGRSGGTNSAGVLADQHSVSLIEDNIFRRNSSTIQENAGSVGNAWLYNLGVENVSGNDFLINHGPHNSTNLYEGNFTSSIKSDGYFGSCGDYTLYGNVFHGSNDAGTVNGYSLTMNRWTRGFAIVKNIFGWDGVSDGLESYGNPNIGNGNADGFAGPTGLSDQAGQPDYMQPGYGEFEYIIQPTDIFAGDFWADFGPDGYLAGTLTSRISDTSAVITMDTTTGQMEVGDGLANNGPAIWWGGHTSFRKKMKITAIDGLDVTFALSGYEEGSVMPAEGTALEVWTGQTGYQERDLDVKPSFELVHNYRGNAGGTGGIENPTADTLPDSMAYAAKPGWWPVDLTWPPVNPNAPQFTRTNLDAGRRYDAMEGFPAVTITTPETGDTFTPADVIEFTATASDIEDGDLSDDIEWESSLDGPLGTGATINVSLSAGTHTITAKATDSDENEGVRSIILTVAVPPVPRPAKLKSRTLL